MLYEELLTCEELVLIEPWASFEERWFKLSRQKLEELKNEKRHVDRRRNQETGRFEKNSRSKEGREDSRESFKESREF